PAPVERPGENEPPGENVGARPDGPSPHTPIFRLLAAFGVSLALLCVSMFQKYPQVDRVTTLDTLSWIVCGGFAGWNALEYVLGGAAHGRETPPWLRVLLAVPYFAVSWIAVRTLAAMIAGLALLVGVGG
ncbi:MAG TPA: hypothetical protein VLS93_15360, partial [Anaeromyxobacteraceae bacterium]|nr:hypothetical protein [Anaeromyxobacteraceae bacterium]